MSNSKDGRPPVPPDVYMRVLPDAPRSDRLLDRLVSLFDLRAFGESGLTTSGRIAMRRGALLLGIVFVFDIFMFSLLLYTIFSKGTAEADSLVVIALALAGALALALVLALTTVTFEANLFTADLSRWREPRVFVGILGRVAWVVILAFLTAEPFHMLLFDGPVTRRAQQEQGIETAVSLVKAQVEEEAEIRARQAGAIPTGFEGQIKDIDDQIAKLAADERKLVGDIGEEEGNYKTAKAKASSLRDQADRLEAQARSETDPDRRTELEAKATRKYGAAAAEASNRDTAKDALDRLRGPDGESGELGLVRAELERLRGSAAPAADAPVPRAGPPAGEPSTGEQSAPAGPTSERGRILERERLDRDQKLKDAQAVIDVKQDFVFDIINGVPGTSISVTDARLSAPLVFTFREPDFWERVRILSDLTDGERPRWPIGELTAEEAAMLRDDMKLSRVPPTTAEADRFAKWETEQRNLERDAWSYTVFWWLILALGMAVPLLAFFYKLLLPEELTNYYTVSWQSRLGNPEARMNDPRLRVERPRPTLAALPLAPREVSPLRVEAVEDEPAEVAHVGEPPGTDTLPSFLGVPGKPATPAVSPVPPAKAPSAVAASGAPPAPDPATRGDAEEPGDAPMADPSLADLLDDMEHAEAAESTLPETPAPASVPMMITMAMRERLRNLGMSDTAIDRTTPETAWRILQGTTPPPVDPAAVDVRDRNGTDVGLEPPTGFPRPIPPGPVVSEGGAATWLLEEPPSRSDS